MTQPSAPDEAHSLVVTAGAKTPAPYAAPALFALECSPGRAARLVYRSSSLSVPVDPMVEAILDGAPLPLPELWQVAEETRTVTTLILPLPDAALARKLAALLSGGEKLVLRAPQSPPDIFDLRQATGSLAGCA